MTGNGSLHREISIKDYGPQIEPFLEPFKTWIDSGVKLVAQGYGARARDTEIARNPYQSEGWRLRRAYAYLLNQVLSGRRFLRFVTGTYA